MRLLGRVCRCLLSVSNRERLIGVGLLALVMCWSAYNTWRRWELESSLERTRQAIEQLREWQEEVLGKLERIEKGR